MRIAVTLVEPALDKFYGLLNDEQKAKITALAAAQRPAPRKDLPNCNAAQPGATEWPSEQIERNVKPTDALRPRGLPRLEHGLMSCSRPSERCDRRSITSTAR